MKIIQSDGSKALIWMFSISALLVGCFIGIFFTMLFIIEKLSVEHFFSYFTLLIAFVAALSAFLGTMYSKDKELKIKEEEFNHDLNKIRQTIFSTAWIDVDLYKTAVMDLYNEVYQHSSKRLDFNLLLEISELQKVTYKNNYTDKFKYDFEHKNKSMIDSRESWYHIRGKVMHLDAQLHKNHYVDNLGAYDKYKEFTEEARRLRDACNKMISIADSFSLKAYEIKKTSNIN